MSLILRIDDCNGWNIQNSDFEYFKRWREAIGGENLNIIYGFVPDLLKEGDLDWLYANLGPGEILAVHGWDHVRGKQPTLRQMLTARGWFEADIYIPPFNEYTLETVKNWKEVGGKIFLGGFDGEHHNLGSKVVEIEGVYHFNAPKETYDKVWKVTDFLERNTDYSYGDTPYVVTLHATWDKDSFSSLKYFGSTFKFRNIYEFIRHK